MLREFLLLLREIIGVNRAGIFLRKPAGAGADFFRPPPPNASIPPAPSACPPGCWSIWPCLSKPGWAAMITGKGGRVSPEFLES